MFFIDWFICFHGGMILILQVISHSIKRHGVFKGLVYILFLKVSAQTTKMLGMAPGGEFRVAVHEANQIRKAH